MGCFKDTAEKTGNDVLSLTTSSILLSSFSVGHHHKTGHPSRVRRKEALSHLSRPAGDLHLHLPHPHVDLQLLTVQLKSCFRLFSYKKYSSVCFYPAVKFKD